MSTEDLQEKINRYHETLVKERKLKDQLVKKLQAITEIVARHKSPRMASKAGGIPFGLGGVVAAAFMPVSAQNDTTHSDKLLEEIKKVLTR